MLRPQLLIAEELLRSVLVLGKGWALSQVWIAPLVLLLVLLLDFERYLHCLPKSLNF